MSDTFVYFLRPIGQSGPVKIGCSQRPRSRLSDLGEFGPVRLELVAAVPGDLELERNVHECFLDSHSHREWFNISPRLQACLEALQAGRKIQDAVDLTKRLGVFRPRAKPKRMTSPASLERAEFNRRRGTVAPEGHPHWPVDIDMLMITVMRHVPLTNSQRARIERILNDPAQFLSAEELVAAYAGLRDRAKVA